MNRLSYALMSLLFSPIDRNKDILVCYASHTGTAAHLAQQTALILQKTGRAVHVVSLGSITPEELTGYKQVLMIVSTCGEGEMPDEGKLFYEQLSESSTLPIPTHLLALGDKSYPHYCSAGIEMHKALLALGAAVESEATLVNGNPLSTWQAWLTQCTGTEVDSKSIAPISRELTLELKEKTALHSNKMDDASNQAFHIEFEITGDKDRYKINELVAITPPNSDKERLYSIASSSYSTPGRLALTIAKHQFFLDGELTNGACSNFLIEELNLGEQLDVKIKLGGGMPLPEPNTPVILVATGAGIAPMMSQLNERQFFSHSGENWMIFGNRHYESDYYYRNKLEEFKQNNVITYLDTAFSRDSESKVYVQDILKKHNDRLTEWLLDKGANLYVCGRPELKEEILSVIEVALLERFEDEIKARETLCALQNNCRIYFELF